ncbi:Mediator of RNA polymerase II transcription subunit 17 [Purpureocillium lavendulum]|uniref:Mediator of RNA polymerase II transcription subunit 17 n=1 Tax=Purpureocillium lavendulum TaxID=1247861 RepID=A0AB34G5F3_9HYPO|nr:Mediator of RNA polymerase II transcription subunit 17 [Purpureocillium lavendulum]
MDPDQAIIDDFVEKAAPGFRGIYRIRATPEFKSLSSELKCRINAKLRSPTTSAVPGTDEEWERDCRIVEADARAALEADGCPPCYPADLPVPLPKPLPCEYYDIVTFWRAHLSTTDHVLAAQHADWLTFRRWQRRHRKRHHRKRDHRKRHSAAKAKAKAQPAPAQARLKTWDDFYAYHKRHYKAIVHRRDEDKDEVSTVMRPLPPGVFYLYMQGSGTAQHEMQMYSKLLAWIELRREDMATAARVERAAQAFFASTSTE